VGKAPILLERKWRDSCGHWPDNLGAIENSDANEQYDIYREFRNPEDEIYLQLGQSREELYNQANKDGLRGDKLTVSGVILAAGASYLLYKKIRKQNKELKFEVQPTSNILNINNSAFPLALNLKWTKKF
jgi:hypothetical protein